MVLNVIEVHWRDIPEFDISQLYDWLYENVGSSCNLSRMFLSEVSDLNAILEKSGCDWHYRIDYPNYYFYFKDLEDALLFKLIWC